jgi:hypothetical protein
MAIDPRIPLMAQAPDTGGAITRGLQSAQSIMAMQQMQEERERQKRLQPLQEQVLKAQVAAIPGEQEDLARKRQLQSMKINATADFMLAKKIEPLIASGKWDDALKLVNSDKTISDETKGLASSVLENKDTLGAISLLNSAYENGYSVAGFERPESGKINIRTVTDPSTQGSRFGRFDQQGNFLGYVEGVIPASTTTSKTSEQNKIDNDKRRDFISRIAFLNKQGLLPENSYQTLTAMAASANPDTLARTLADVTGMGDMTPQQLAMINKDYESFNRKYTEDVASARERAKSNATYTDQAFKAASSVDSQITGYQRALELLEEEGASTGPIEKRLFSLRDSTIELNKLQSVLALDALASTNLTPVSNADLETLRDGVLPTELNDLKSWIRRKLTSLQNMRPVLQQQAKYFGTSGASVGQWLDPLNWKERQFTLIPSANRPGGADRATNVEVQRGNVPNIPFSPPPPAPGMPSDIRRGGVPEDVLNQPISGSTRTPRPVIRYNPNTFLFDDEQ